MEQQRDLCPESTNGYLCPESANGYLCPESANGYLCPEPANGYVCPDLAGYFKKSELIPAVVQQRGTGAVLMLAYMNEESLAKTLETGFTWFYSRSRGALWNKGESSGHFQRVVSVTPDCDDDALLIVVEQTGAACHTGNMSCFYRTGLLYGGHCSKV